MSLIKNTFLNIACACFCTMIYSQSTDSKEMADAKNEVAKKFVSCLMFQRKDIASKFISPNLDIITRDSISTLVNKGIKDLPRYTNTLFISVPSVTSTTIDVLCSFFSESDEELYRIIVSFNNIRDDMYIIDLRILDESELHKKEKEWQEYRKNNTPAPPRDEPIKK